MVRITEELIRKKSEHNEGEIHSLEEISLHQEDIEKIELLQNWCRDLQILLLQSNIISKIENVNKLKCLKYLNLALNNIEVIENLERCESLEKLDLTLNFVGDIESVCSLKNNIHLRELHLLGNPCADYKGYRAYVITKLPQLTNFDNRDITRTERFKALRIINDIEKEMVIEQEKYRQFRIEQKSRLCIPNETADEEYWKQKSENAPETRVELAIRTQRRKSKDEKPKPEKKPAKLFRDDGRPLNVNQAKAKFTFAYDDPAELVLDIKIFKFLDNNLLKVDLQPTYVTVHIKGKVFQLVFPEEICVDDSVAQRSQTSGHLVITMPKLSAKLKNVEKRTEAKPKEECIKPAKRIQRREMLEIGPERKEKLHEIFRITEEKEDDFVDDPDVPPLE